jgi:hypothetical protein
MEECTLPKCKQADAIKKLQIDVAVAQSNIQDVKDDIREIKNKQGSMNMWLIGIMGSSILSLVVLIFNILSSKE